MRISNGPSSQSDGHDTLLTEIPDIAANLVWPGAMSRSRRNRFIEHLGRAGRHPVVVKLEHLNCLPRHFYQEPAAATAAAASFTQTVPGTRSMGQWYLIEGRAEVLGSGAPYDEVKGKFPWVRGALLIQVEKVTAQL